MGRYGAIREYKISTIQLKMGEALEYARDFYNAGDTLAPSFLESLEIDWIEDIFVGPNTIFILPKSKESALEIWKKAILDWNKETDEGCGVASEIDWEKYDGRYWLRVWWD